MFYSIDSVLIMKMTHLVAVQLKEVWKVYAKFQREHFVQQAVFLSYVKD